MDSIKTMRRVLDYVFHSEKAEAGESGIENPGYDYLVIEVKRSAGTGTIKFWGSMTTKTQANMVAILGTNLVDETTKANNTTGTGELWRLDVRGLAYVNIEVDAVSGGNYTITGRFS